MSRPEAVPNRTDGDRNMAAETHRKFIERIDRTIVALLLERTRIGEALNQLTDRLGDGHELDVPVDGGAR